MSDREAMVLLQERLAVRFKDESLLMRALRHRSVILDRPLDSNERMEFLGDAILGMVVCEFLYSQFPDSSEGDLAKAKAYLVSEPTLARAAQGIGLELAVEVSSGEAASGGRMRRSILADAFEAVIAAIFLDLGIRATRRVVRKSLQPALREVIAGGYHQDFKSSLQERTQARSRKTPTYRIASETGADHDKTFIAQAVLGKKVIGEGAGKSKKEAEQAAARVALESLGEAQSDTKKRTSSNATILSGIIEGESV